MIFRLDPIQRHDSVGVALTFHSRLDFIAFLFVLTKIDIEFLRQGPDEVFGEDNIPKEHRDEQAAHCYLIEASVLLEHEQIPFFVVDAQQGEDERVIDIAEAELVGRSILQVELSLAVEEDSPALD